MPVQIESLPPWAQAQALRKVQEQEARRKWPPVPAASQADGEGKYHNRKAQRVLGDGTVLIFDSQKEARRFDQLAQALQAGKIRDLKLQPQFTLQEAYTTMEGKRVRAIRYQADFSYERATAPDCTGAVYWLKVVEDVKSKATKTRVYEIKKKLMRERFGVEVMEV